MIRMASVIVMNKYKTNKCHTFVSLDCFIKDDDDTDDEDEV